MGNDLKNLASVFISYSWKDQELAKKVVYELGRRGIVAWFDLHDAKQDTKPLLDGLRSAIAEQALFVGLITKSALTSVWVPKEHGCAKDAGVPMYAVVPDGAAFADDRWVSGGWSEFYGSADGDDQTMRCTSSDPAEIAEKISESVLQTLQARNCFDVGINVIVDHRGPDRRHGQVANMLVPADPMRRALPTFVFRPDSAHRLPTSTLEPDQWREFLRQVTRRMDRIIALTAVESFNLLSNSQLATAFFLGRYFRRQATNGTLHCLNKEQSFLEFSYKLRERLPPSQRDRARAFPIRNAPPEPPESTGQLALFVGANSWWPAVRRHIQAPWVPAWLEVNEDFLTAADARTCVADIVKYLERFEELAQLRVYSSLPDNVLPLLGGVLHERFTSVRRIEFMEFRWDLVADPSNVELYSPYHDG